MIHIQMREPVFVFALFTVLVTLGSIIVILGIRAR